MAYDNWTDKELIDELQAIDEAEDLGVTEWEMDFMDSIFEKDNRSRQGYRLSTKQRDVIVSMIEKYQGEY